jgi:hypothetical protein
LEDARHEAAHAVVGVFLGLRLHWVRLLDGGWHGYSHFQCPRSKRLQAGIMFAAGPAGDAIHGLKHHWGWGGDLGEISDLWFTAGERRVLIDMATRYLRGPCKRPWEAVTEVLMARDISGKEIKALIEHGEQLEP